MTTYPDEVEPRVAAFFDLDKTIIAKSSSLAFSRPFYKSGLINRRAVLRSAYAQFVYLAGGADHDQMERMRAYLQELCAGWPVEQVRAVVAETLHELIDPIVYDEAVSLIEEHHDAGHDVVIVSSSGAEVVGPDRRDARRRRGDRDPHGGRGRSVHRRDRVLRVRPEQGRGDARACRRQRVRPRRLLRLQRLAHRPAHAGSSSATRSPSTPTRSCAAKRPSAGGRCWSSTLRSRCVGASPSAWQTCRRSNVLRWPASRAPQPPPAWSGTPARRRSSRQQLR